MKNKHRKTLQAIFKDPVSGAIVWTDIEAMFTALGGDVSQRAGSRVGVLLNGKVAVFHRPHPRKETDKGAVKSVRNFLMQAGVNPNA